MLMKKSSIYWTLNDAGDTDMDVLFGVILALGVLSALFVVLAARGVPPVEEGSDAE